MALAAITAGGALLCVVPLGLGLEGVWGAITLLMTVRLLTMIWRYQSGPLARTRLHLDEDQSAF